MAGEPSQDDAVIVGYLSLALRMTFLSLLLDRAMPKTDIVVEGPTRFVAHHVRRSSETATAAVA